MKVLITGATGLIGSALIRQCRDHKIAVHYLSTRNGKIREEEGCKGFYWNPGRGEIDLNCFEGVTGIINLAGAPVSQRWTKANKKKILNSRLDSLQTLLSALEKIDSGQISSFVSASAIGIYPNSLDHFYTEEEVAVDDSFLGRVVQQWEQKIDAFQKFSFPVAKVRIGLVLATEGGALPAMVRPIKAYMGAAFGSGEQWQSWIHVEDLARQFMFVLENKLSGTFNGVAPNPVTNGKLIKEIAEVLKKPLLLPNIPRAMMRLVLGEMSYILFASQRVSCKKIEEEGFEFYHKNICSALRDLYPTETTSDNSLYKEFI